MSVIYRHLVDEAGFSPEQAKSALAPWEIRNLEMAGEKVGEIMLLNNEVHFAIDHSHRGILGRIHLLRDVLTGLLKEKKFLVTRLAPNDKCRPLIEAFGFTHVNSDDDYEYFWMNEGDPIKVLQREATHDCY